MSAQFPIVDAHRHFWDPRVNYYPWLCDQPPVPFRYGDYSALRRPYLPADYFADAGQHEVVKTVYVETEWDPRDPLGETAWVDRLRRETGFPTVAVAQAWLDRDDAASVLERQAAFAFVRGIRHKPRPGAMRDRRWRAGYALLARFGLRFDLQAPWTELADAAALCRAFPDTQRDRPFGDRDFRRPARDVREQLPRGQPLRQFRRDLFRVSRDHEGILPAGAARAVPR